MIATLAFGAALIGAHVQADKPMIRSAADLPPTTFSLNAAPSAAFLDDAFMSETVPALRAEAERVLATYEIEDPAVLQRLRYGLASIAILQDRPADATFLIAAQRTGETKPQLKAIGFLLGDAIAASLHAPEADRCKVAVEVHRQRNPGFRLDHLTDLWVGGQRRA